MKAKAWGVVLCAFIALFYVIAQSPSNDVEPTTHAPSDVERIEEDDPRWDCETMGNRDCGPAPAPAPAPEPEHFQNA